MVTQRDALLVSVVLTVALAALTLVHVRAATAQSKPRLFVYAGTDLSSQALRQRMQPALPALLVSVFGRLRDFRAAIAAERPDAVLAQEPLLRELGMVVHVQGFAGGSPTEPYALVTRERVGPAEIPGLAIAMVDLFGQHDMLPFAERLLGGRRPRTLRRVTEPADLMAMLSLNLAQGVILPLRLVAKMRVGSEMSLVVNTLPDGAVGRHALHLADPGQRPVYLKQLREFPTALSQELGVDEWR